jgi:FlaA1/EpsC-like NDP-sugar epimerase
VLTASRSSFRLIAEALHRSRKAATRVVIYGAGDGGSLIVRELTQAPGARHKILGFVDDDERKQRMRVQGYPVLGGYASLESLVLSGVVDAVVISARIIDVQRLRTLESLCAEHEVSLSRLHVGFEAIVIGSDNTLAVEPGKTLRKNIS